MTSHLKKIIIPLLTLYSLLFTPKPIFAQEQEGGIYEEDVVSFQWLETLFKNVLGVMLTLIGFASFIMIIVGAFNLLTAGSNQEAVQKGKSTLTYGILGLFLALIVWFIFYFIAQFTGAQILEFTIPS